MDYRQHAHLSVKKFGGRPEDYLAIHRFIDSGKLFRYHIKHRLLLHNLYGVELAIERFGDCLENSQGQVVLVRDVAHAHCREDLGGRVPSLNEWLEGIELHGQTDARERPRFEPPELDAFMWKPYLRTGLDASLEITFSDFGVHLVENVLSRESALAVTERLGPLPSIGSLLDAFRFQDRWQHSPRRRELEWLRTTEQP